MVDSTGFQLPPPTDWPAFERVMRQLFARVFKCPLGEMVGRTGQDQAGIDIIGRKPDGERGYFGIQCKLKDEIGKKPELRLAALEKEIAQADSIRPRLSQFILVTTAANDVALQAHARVLTASREQSDYPLDISVIGWDQLRAMIGEHRDLLENYLGIEGVADLAIQSSARHEAAMGASAGQHAEVMGMLEQLAERMTSPAHIVAPPLDTEDPRLERAIDRIKAKLDGEDIRGGLADLEALKVDEWEDATSIQRFRILSNLGAGRWRLGEYDVAAELFREAAALNPDDPRALANLAASATNSGDPHEGLRAAQRMLELDPGSSEAVLPLIQAHELVEPSDDPLDPVPLELRESEEAFVGAAQVYRNRGDERWLSLVESGRALFPQSDLLARMGADSILHLLAMVEGAHLGVAADNVPSRAEVEWAADTLATGWRKSLACDPVHPDLSVAHNLAQLLRALERQGEAIEVLVEAEHYGSESDQIALLHALLLVAIGRTDEAIVRLRARKDHPPSRILLAQLLIDRPDDVIAVLDGAAVPEGTREDMWQRVLLAEARAALDPNHDPEMELEAIAAAWRDCLVPLLALGKRVHARKEQFAVAERILAASSPATEFPDILQACVWFREANFPSAVVDLLENRIDRSTDSMALRWLIEAWFSVDDRAELTATLEALPEPVADLPRYIYYRHRASYRSGDMPGARAAIERLIARGDKSLGTRLDWIQIMHRIPDRKAVDLWLESNVEQLEGSPEQRADLALLLANHGFYNRARRLAYRLARQNPDNRLVLDRYNGVVLNPPPPGESDLTLSSVGPNAVFRVTDDQGNEKTYRIEAEDSLPVEAIDLTATSPVAVAAHDLKEGDTFQLESGLAGLPPRTYSIGPVLHKHIYLFRWLTDVLPERFGGAPAIYKASIDPESGEGMEALSGHLREQEAVGREILDDYLETARPLRVVAAITERCIIDTYDGMTSIEGGGFASSDGGGPEFDRECRALVQNNARGCVADTVTMEIIRRHDLLEIVKDIAGPISVAQGTLDDLIDRAHKSELMMGRFQGNLAHQDGRLVAERVYPAHIEAAIDVRRSALAWLQEHTNVRAAIGPPDLARKLADLLPEELSGQFQDETLLAAETGTLLLSDDQGYRRFANQAGVHQTAGLTALLRIARLSNTIDHAAYVRAIAAFGRARHRFIAIDDKDLREALDQDGGEIGATMRGLANLFGGRGAKLKQQWPVAAAFLSSIWDDQNLVSERIAIIWLFADRFLSEYPAERREFTKVLLRDPDCGVGALDRAMRRSTL